MPVVVDKGEWRQVLVKLEDVKMKMWIFFWGGGGNKKDKGVVRGGRG